ncbi:PQQ-dependent sugar dehydrogenase [Roseobacter sinensis]|uniref:PQQ-dependent sugar dehydrogenase n=1 Tax=Roseobacter sinensis TaxID=2931391 RepID=A0ABT3B924_9RHOB|nr:PQQ-dependent sugar dehydrogenase [Roseobacter sp. WL0113]MCV3270073.1 PQQ-dependent sugar dehydrogenase [Roseobacter sp. WL0113]
MKTSLAGGVFGALVVGAASIAWAEVDGTSFVTAEHSFVLETVAEGLEHPWGLDFLPDGRIIVTERPGRLRIVEADGTLGAPLGGMPDIVSEFRDGLLDVTASPAFAEDRTVYFAYSDLEDGARWLKIMSAQIGDGAVENLTPIFESDLRVESNEGYGARIRFDADGHLMITFGDHADPPTAQDGTNTLGSIIRITTDGTPVDGNPGGDLHPAIYAWGFKNSHGIAIAEDGTIWAIDHGGVGGDELNRIEMGANYGWPARQFGGADAPGAETPSEFKEPTFTWGIAPTVALSGLEIYEGDLFPNWQGDLFTGSLVQQALIRIMLGEDGEVIGTEYVIDGVLGRVREVREAPDGTLYVLNDDFEGGIYRIVPE